MNKIGKNINILMMIVNTKMLNIHMIVNLSIILIIIEKYNRVKTFLLNKKIKE